MKLINQKLFKLAKSAYQLNEMNSFIRVLNFMSPSSSPIFILNTGGFFLKNTVMYPGVHSSSATLFQSLECLSQISVHMQNSSHLKGYRFILSPLETGTQVTVTGPL